MIIDDIVHIEDFFNTGNFKEGTIFGRSSRVTCRGTKSYWCYKCPVCSFDEYVQEGLCTGIFECLGTTIKNGGMSCRCSLSYRWSCEQIEYKIKKQLNDNYNGYTFIKFVDGYKNKNSKCIIKCFNQAHDEYESTIHSTLHNGYGCPKCGGHNQKQCYINTIKENDNTIALKYGIAVNSERRLQQQNYNSTYTIDNFGVWEFDNVPICKEAEKECKRIFGKGIIIKENMRTGHTETTAFENLNRIIEIYESFGGKRIDN